MLVCRAQLHEFIILLVKNVIRTALSVTDFTVDFIVAGTAKRHQV